MTLTGSYGSQGEQPGMKLVWELGNCRWFQGAVDAMGAGQA